MTVNAVFVDIREIVGAATLPSPMGRAAHLIAQQDWPAAEKLIRLVRELLAAARGKFEVWDDRHALSRLIEEQTASFGQVDRDRIRALLGKSVERAYVPLIHRPTDFDVEMVAPHAAALVDSLRRQMNVIASATAPALQLLVALQMRPVRAGDGGDRLFELADEGGDDRVTEYNRTLDRALEALTHDDWRGVTEPGTRATELPGQGRFNLEETDDLESLVSVVGQRLADLVVDVRRDLQRDFVANVVRPPMPAPFVVDLTPPFVASTEQLQVERVAGVGFRQGEELKVAALRCGIPEQWYVADDSAYQLIPERVDLLIDVLRRSAREAAAVDAQILVLPEVFIPASAIDEVQALAADLGITVVGGMEMHRDRGGIVNRALVALPNSCYEQRKQRPSVYEVRSNEFSSDGVLRVFGEPGAAGSFAVMVCSDYLELDLVGAIDRVGLLLVCSRNPNPAVFTHLAAADSYRRYAHVVISNAHPGGAGVAATGEGTVAVGPLRDDPFIQEALRKPLGLESEFSPNEPPSLSVYRLGLDAIAHRRNRRPDHGYLSPSHHSTR